MLFFEERAMILRIIAKFWGEGTTGIPGVKPLRAKKITNNKLSTNISESGNRLEPGPHWWEANALTTAPSLLAQHTIVWHVFQQPISLLCADSGTCIYQTRFTGYDPPVMILPYPQSREENLQIFLFFMVVSISGISHLLHKLIKCSDFLRCFLTKGELTKGEAWQAAGYDSSPLIRMFMFENPNWNLGIN